MQNSPTYLFMELLGDLVLYSQVNKKLNMQFLKSQQTDLNKYLFRERDWGKQTFKLNGYYQQFNE
jgi:hypothetical protein